MSIRAIADRKILFNNTNMDNLEDDTTNKATWSGVNGVCDAEGVRTDSTPPAASPVVLNSTIGAQPVGVVIHCSRSPRNTALTRKDCSRSTHGCSGKFASEDQEAKERVEDRTDPTAKKRKTRRGKPKHRKLKPYTKQSMSYEQRLRCRAVGRLTKTGGHPPAPYNTTQFLMEDHSDLPDFDKKLADAITSEVPAPFQKPLAPSRTRDSSFSIDSEDDYFYSSPENEEEFLTKEFSSAYEDLHAERLNTLTKSELIQEYVQLEAKLDILTKRLRGKNIQQIDERESGSKNCTATTTMTTTTTTTMTTTPTTTTTMTTSTSDSEVAKKLKICQQRMDDLMQQNEQLRRDNEALRAKHCSSPISSVDSESDSESTSGGNPSSCSCSPGSSGSPITTTKPFLSRREKNYRRSNKRLSNVDSDNSSVSTASSQDSSCMKDDEGEKHLGGEVINGTGPNPGGLPT